MNVNVGDTLEMKKKLPAAATAFWCCARGWDFRSRCLGCGHEIMVPRVKAERNIKKILPASAGENKNGPL